MPRRSKVIRIFIGEFGFVLMMLIGLGIGIHLGLFVLFGVPLAGVLYWLVPSVPAFLMALLLPDPAQRLQRYRCVSVRSMNG